MDGFRAGEGAVEAPPADRGPTVFASTRSLLLELLSETGWSVAVTPAELGVLVTARGHGLVVCVEGASVAAVTPVVFEAAAAAMRGER